MIRTAEISTPLAGNATRAGSTYDVATDSPASLFRAFASADVAGTVTVQQSRDQVTWYTTLTPVAVAADATSGTVVEAIPTLRYVRAFYTNGAGAQGAFEFDSALVEI